MNELRVILDSRLRPDLFHWNGPIPAAQLQDWLRSHHLIRCPADLVRLWEVTGGGDLLESETILGPFGDRSMGDSVDVVNDELRRRGLPENLIVFHTGIATSAVDTEVGDYVQLGADERHIISRYRSP